jgi:hypothetical protein
MPSSFYINYTTTAGNGGGFFLRDERTELFVDTKKGDKAVPFFIR